MECVRIFFFKPIHLRSAYINERDDGCSEVAVSSESFFEDFGLYVLIEPKFEAVAVIAFLFLDDDIFCFVKGGEYFGEDGVALLSVLVDGGKCLDGVIFDEDEHIIDVVHPLSFSGVDRVLPCVYFRIILELDFAVAVVDTELDIKLFVELSVFFHAFYIYR
jgi:hypothetical protein